MESASLDVSKKLLGGALNSRVYWSLVKRS